MVVRIEIIDWIMMNSIREKGGIGRKGRERQKKANREGGKAGAKKTQERPDETGRLRKTRGGRRDRRYGKDRIGATPPKVVFFPTWLGVVMTPKGIYF